MFFKASLLASLSGTAAAETIFNALIFTRHGDRTAKYFNNAVLTNLGADQTYQSGTFYRDRYLVNGSDFQVAGISSDVVVPTQLYATAPMSSVLYQSATDFLQGFYPPLVNLDDALATQELANGTEVVAPLGGYQYIMITGEDTNSPDTIWLQGDTNCPAFTTASATYAQSPEYKETYNATLDFYANFTDVLGPILGASNLTFKNAYTIFDLLNVASIHNTSVAPEIDEEALLQAQYLADTHEFNTYYNATMNMRSIAGQTFAAQVLAQMNTTVASKAAKQKVTLLAGSYDVFLAFFGLTNLTSASADFYGLPAYAASMAFELFSDADNATFPADPATDLNVRFLFRNGTDSTDELTAYPLFGNTDTVMTYGDFVDTLTARSVTTLAQWCDMCGSTQSYCVAANATSSSSTSSSSSTASLSADSSTCSSLSNAAAGGIGAGVTIFVVGILAGVAAMMLLNRRNKALASTGAPAAGYADNAGSAHSGMEKGASHSVSSASRSV